MTTSEATESGDQWTDYCTRKDTAFRYNGQAISKVHERCIALENASPFLPQNAGKSVWGERINILYRTIIW